MLESYIVVPHAFPRSRRLALALFLFAALCVPYAARAQGPSPIPAAPPVLLTDESDEYHIDGNLEVLENTAERLTLADVMSAPYAHQFAPNVSGMLHLGLNGATDWVRFRVRNTSGRNYWILGINDTRIPYVEVYRMKEEGGEYGALRTGDYLPYSTREIPDRTFLFSLQVPRDTEQTVYVRLQSPFPVDVPLTVLTGERLLELNRPNTLLFGMFYGAMLIMAGYNVFVFLSLRDRAYLYLALVILGFAASKAAQDGLGHEYLWPGASNRGAIEYSILGTMLATSFFTTRFLELKERAPRSNLLFNVWRALTIVAALLVPFVNLLLFITALMAVEVALILGVIVRAWQAGYRPARAFFATWLLPLVTALIYLLYYFGVLPNSFFTNNLLLAFLAALALLWSFVLADRINILRAATANVTRNLAIRERQYRSLFQDSRDAVFVMTRAGELVDLNAAGQQLLGLARAEPSGRAARDLFCDPADYEHFRRALEREGFVSNFEARLHGHDASVITVVVSATLWRDEERGMSGYQGILRDVTERRRIEHELATYRLNLEELVAARTTQARAELAERLRAEGELEQRIQELFILNEIARTISSVTDLMPALNLVAERVTHLFGITATSIGELDPVAPAIHILAGYSSAPETLSLVGSTFTRETLPILDDVLETNEPLVLAEREADERVAKAYTLMEYVGVTSLMLTPLRAGGVVNGVMILQSQEPEPFATDHVRALAETIAGTIATAIENARLFQQAQATAIADERRRLARELHDSVTQLLYSIVLLAEGWGTEAEESELDRQQQSHYFRELGDLGQQALGEMRLLLYQLRSPVLSEIGLSGALEQRLKAVEERVGIQTYLDVAGAVDELPLHVQAELYFIAQEALNNALRHARASVIHVRLEKEARHLELLIRDNGGGFDHKVNSEGMGLRNMAVRAQILGGQLEILSTPGQGTRVQLQMALD